MKPKWILFGLAGVVLVQTAFGVATYYLLPSWQDRGTFGDMFGAANAFFSGLALFGVVVAILLQQRELSLQREELELTRAELARSADAQRASVELLAAQLALAKEAAADAYSRSIADTDPVLRWHSDNRSSGYAKASVKNFGAMVENLQVAPLGDGFQVSVRPTAVLPREEFAEIEVRYQRGETIPVEFTLGFVDRLGRARSKEYRYDPNSGALVLRQTTGAS